MNNIPVEFCSGVVARLERNYFFCRDHLDLGATWKLAVISHFENTEKLKVILRPKPTASCWEYAFIGQKYFSFEEMRAKNQLYTRITEVEFRKEYVAPKRATTSKEDQDEKPESIAETPFYVFRDISKEDVKNEFIPYIVGQLVYDPAFTCSMDRTEQTDEITTEFFKVAARRPHFKAIKTNYQGPACEEFIAVQEELMKCRGFLTLTGTDWPSTIKSVITTLLSRGSFIVDAKTSNIGLDPEMFTTLFNLWMQNEDDPEHYDTKMWFRGVMDTTEIKKIRPDIQKVEVKDGAEKIDWILENGNKHSFFNFYAHGDEIYIGFY
ncbi:hypothetical protein QR680_011826 [Steinernema hermaphroditum]|uniref:Uncharacterized protein n=1 Tax=Steinernema hermaphroditum TaxID=289476 RepID=A0AA39LZE4_9BILA|nr:hypothetical protein QR680_011826 [Steinernema hermaphroditum]